MTTTDLIVWLWTIASIVGLPITLYAWWGAWRARQIVIAARHPSPRWRMVADQGVIAQGWRAIVQAIFLLIGLFVLTESPARGEAVRWGLLAVQLGTVALSLVDHHYRRRLLNGS